MTDKEDLRTGSFTHTSGTCNKMATEISTPGKKISQLRVIDLKEELERRGLEKSGVKAALTDRLKKVSVLHIYVFTFQMSASMASRDPFKGIFHFHRKTTYFERSYYL